MFEYFCSNNKINEVIFLGGDLLMVKDDYLLWLVNEIVVIFYIKWLCIYSCLLVVLLEWISYDFVEWFSVLLF